MHAFLLFVSATGGTFDSEIPGTFESDTGGTFNPLLSKYTEFPRFSIAVPFFFYYYSSIISKHPIKDDLIVWFGLVWFVLPTFRARVPGEFPGYYRSRGYGEGHPPSIHAGQHPWPYSC